MYPARFEYHAPSSVEEALELLERYGDEAKVLAGGQSLIPLMKLRFASPRALVDINRIEGLDTLAEDDGFLSIGALVRHTDCETLGDAARALRRPRRRRAADLRPDRAQPRHRRRLAHARRPAGRLGLGAARHRRPARGHLLGRHAHDPARRALPGPVHDEPAAERDRDRRPGPGPRRAAPAAPTSSSSARSATSPPSASPSTSRWTTGRVGSAGIALTGVGPKNLRAAGRRAGARRRGAERRHDPSGGRGRRRGRAAAERPSRERRLQAERRPRLHGARAPEGRRDGGRVRRRR